MPVGSAKRITKHSVTKASVLLFAVITERMHVLPVNTWQLQTLRRFPVHATLVPVGGARNAMYLSHVLTMDAEIMEDAIQHSLAAQPTEPIQTDDAVNATRDMQGSNAVRSS